jgi:hypothetical protein
MYCSERLVFEAPPLPIFGESYYSSGSFSYYKEFRIPLKKEYYVLSVNQTDPPVFWPLALHEMAHCWLGRHEYVDHICGRNQPDLRNIGQNTAANRVEEALCDIIATHVIGPSYPYAYVSKLWVTFPLPVTCNYPSHRYRIECMARVLDRQGFYEDANDLRVVGDQKFESKWQEEEVSWSLGDLLEVANELPCPPLDRIKRLTSGTSILADMDSDDDFATVFYRAWLVINSADSEQIVATVDKASKAILCFLKRCPVSSNT